MSNLITIAQLLVFFGYVYFVYNRYGILTSISASTYSLQGLERWYFLAFLGSIGTLNFFQGMDVWGFFAGAFLLFAGITIDHNENKAHSDIIHTIGTVGAILFTYIGLWTLHGMWLPLLLLALCTAALYTNKYFIWWIEIIAMSLAMTAYFFR